MTDFWTADRIETLRAMRENGATAVQIGLAVGCSKNAVLGKLDRLGFNTSAGPRKWTPELCERLRVLYATGVPVDEIAAALGISYKAATNQAARMRLPKRGNIFSCAFTSKGRTGSVTPRLPAPFKPRLVVTIEAPSTDLAATILDVTGCRWAITPHDAPKDAHMFCNHPTELNEITGKPRPYCPYHSEMNRAKAVPKAEVKRFKMPTTWLRSVA